MGRRYTPRPELVDAISAIVGGVISDRAPAGSLIAGYMLRLSGESAILLGPIDPEVDLGQLIVSGTMCGNLVSEHNFGFITERTRKAQGDTHFVQPAVATDPVDLNWFYWFDISNGQAHGNVYPLTEGEAIEWTLPPVAATILNPAGTPAPTWELHRITAERGAGLYLPRWRSQNMDLAGLRQTLDGRTASIMMQAASGIGATNPNRLSIFDSQEKRHLFMGWPAALAWTNAINDYGLDEAEEVVYDFYTDSVDSMLKPCGNDRVYVEAVGGVGGMGLSQCIIDKLPAVVRQIGVDVSQITESAQIDRAGRSGWTAPEQSAIIGQAQTGSAVIPTGAARTLLPMEQKPLPGQSVSINPRRNNTGILNRAR